MATSNYRQLLVWQKGMELVRCVYRLTRKLPKSEGFGLSSQLQRAAVSVPANLAEGHTRGSTKEFLRYVVIAHGSLAETETLLLVAQDLQYITCDDLAETTAISDALSKMLGSLRRTLQIKLSSKHRSFSSNHPPPKSLNP